MVFGSNLEGRSAGAARQGAVRALGNVSPVSGKVLGQPVRLRCAYPGSGQQKEGVSEIEFRMALSSAVIPSISYPAPFCYSSHPCLRFCQTPSIWGVPQQQLIISQKISPWGDLPLGAFAPGS